MLKPNNRPTIDEILNSEFI